MKTVTPVPTNRSLCKSAAVEEYGSDIGGGLLAAALGGKITHDTTRIQKRLQGFRSLTPPTPQIPDRVFDPVLGYKVPMDMGEAIETVQKYNTGARGVARSRILGVPAGHLYSAINIYGGLPGLTAKTYYNAAKDAVAAKSWEPIHTAKQRLMQIYRDELEHPLSYGKHMRVYTSNMKPNLVDSHSLSTALGRKEFDSLTPRIKNFIHDADIPLAEKIRRVTSGEFGLEPEHAARLNHAIRQGMLGGSDHLTNKHAVGLAARMLGNNVNITGQNQAYFHGLSPAVKALKGVGKVGLLGGLGYSAVSGYNAYRESQRSPFEKFLRKISSTQARWPWRKEEQPSSLPGGLLAATGVGASGLLGQQAYQDLVNPDRTIATTYGEMSKKYGQADITAGHKNPAKAIEEILREAQQRNSTDPWKVPYVKGAEKYTIGSPIVRGPGGLLSNPNKGRINTIIETGFGMSHVPDDNPGRSLHAAFLENVRPRSILSNQTDAISDTLGHGGMPATVDRRWNKDMFANHGILAWGRNHAEFKARGGYPSRAKIYHMGSDFSPAISRNAVSAVSDTESRANVFRNLMEHYSSSGRDDLADALKTVGGNKPLIVVSGSSRGDYVAQRALDQLKSLEAAGINPKDVDIIAQMGSSFDDPMQRNMLKGTNIISLPAMPQKTYVGLQRLADVHLGSTGASAAAEAVNLPSIQAMDPNLGLTYDDVNNSMIVRPDTTADRMRTKAFDNLVDTQRAAGNLDDRSALRLADAFAALKYKPFTEAEQLVTRARLGLLDEIRDPEILQRHFGWEPNPNAWLPAVDPQLRSQLSILTEKPHIAEPLYQAMSTADGRMVPTAEWNMGNIETMLRQKGTTSDAGVAGIIKGLLSGDPQALKIKADAAARAADKVMELKAARHKMAETIFGNAAKTVRRQRLWGAGKLGLGAGILGLAGNHLLSQE